MLLRLTDAYSDQYAAETLLDNTTASQAELLGQARSAVKPRVGAVPDVPNVSDAVLDHNRQLLGHGHDDAGGQRGGFGEGVEVPQSEGQHDRLIEVDDGLLLRLVHCCVLPASTHEHNGDNSGEVPCPKVSNSNKMCVYCSVSESVRLSTASYPWPAEQQSHCGCSR